MYIFIVIQLSWKCELTFYLSTPSEMWAWSVWPLKVFFFGGGGGLQTTDTYIISHLGHPIKVSIFGICP